MHFLNQIPVGGTIDVSRGQCLVTAGGVGPVWRVTQGVFKLERQGQDGQILVQLAQQHLCHIVYLLLCQQLNNDYQLEENSKLPDLLENL